MEERGAKGAHTLNLRICECAWSKFVELFGAPEHTGTPLGIEKANDPLHLNGLGREGAACAFASGIVHVPAFSNQTEEATPITKGRLDRVMRQIMQREMRGVSRLLLPCDRTILTDATKHSGAIRLFNDLNL